MFLKYVAIVAVSAQKNVFVKTVTILLKRSTWTSQY